MKFSDILKKKGDAGQPIPDQTVPDLKPSPYPAHQSAPVVPVEPSTHPDEPDEVVEKRVQEHAVKATEVYSEAVSAARLIYRAVQTPEQSGPQQTPKDIILKLIALIQSGNQEILALADRSAPDNYLYGHAVNVTIFSIRLGLSIRMTADELFALALGAFLHDIGMVGYLPLALKTVKLSESEMAQIRKHPADGQRLLSMFPEIAGGPLFDPVYQIVGQTHERVEGSGYPAALKADGVHRFAKIVGVCDVYEAISHMRSWRSRLLPHNALRLLIEQHERTFEPGSVKFLIEALSLYPPGSFVRLSSGELGRVIFTNPGLPTRPKVKLLMTAQGQRIVTPKIVNLATQPIQYIAEAVDETKVQTNDQRLLLELRAQRWWVKGL